MKDAISFYFLYPFFLTTLGKNLHL